MNKAIAITIIFFFALLIVVAIVLLMFSKSGNQAPSSVSSLPNTYQPNNYVPPQQNGNASSSASVSGKTISITTSNGGKLETKDFINDPATVPDPMNAGQYYLGPHFPEGINDPSATENPPYVIDFFKSTQFFNIVLYQEPIGAVRREAQQYLMDHLGITQSQMCELKYMVSVPSRVNTFYAGTNLGFSFCPGATQLPN